MKALNLFAALFTLVSVGCREEQKPSPAPTTPATPLIKQTRPQLVPPLEKIDHEFRTVDSLPWLAPEQLRASADVILQFEGAPELSNF